MIALASDHVGLELKREIMAHLEALGLPYKDFGTYSAERCNYPEFAFLAASAVAGGECEKGIVCCGTGVGISIAANKVKGIRCVCCSEPYSALLSRQHNNTNMLAMGSRVVGKDLALMIVDQWLQGKYEGGRHQIRLDEIKLWRKPGNRKNNFLWESRSASPLQRAVKKPAFDHGQRQVFSLLPLRLNKKVCASRSEKPGTFLMRC